MATITYFYRGPGGEKQVREVTPFGTMCYANLIHKNPGLVEKDMKDGLKSLMELVEIEIDACTQSGIPVMHPNACCGRDVAEEANKSHRLQCCTHYFTGLALLAADLKCRTMVRHKIAEQGIQHDVDVELMTDFNVPSREFRVAAKYDGMSIDLFELKIRKDGDVETGFYEGDNTFIEDKIKEFFS